jgi:spermidine/putrescine transport system permease protein
VILPQHRAAWASVSPALGWTLAFFVLPFAAMLAISFYPQDGSGLSLASYAQFFNSPSYCYALFNSLEVTALVTIISILLAYPLAVLPFWTSYVVRSYSWLLVLSEKGLVNTTLVDLGILSAPIQLANTRGATVIGFVHFFVMLLTLTIYANLKQLSPNYRKAAADLGAGPIRSFIHVVLPLTLPGIMVGAFLTFVLAIGDYITPQILGGNNELLMPQLIMMQIGRRGDFSSASALSIILMLVVTVAYLFCARWLKIERT